jgi:hypothetical protein
LIGCRLGGPLDRPRGGKLCEARPEQRHFQQNRAILRTVYMTRQFQALRREMPVRFTSI